MSPPAASSLPDGDLGSLGDAALVAAVARGPGGEGGHAAFEEIVRRYERRVMAFAYSYLQDGDEAAEVAQETFIALYRSAGRYSSGQAPGSSGAAGASFLTYLFSITRNLAMKVRKRSRRRPVSMSSLAGRDAATEDEGKGTAEPEAKAPGPEAAALEAERRSRCEEAVLSLPAKERELLLLRVNQGLKFREIAALTGQSEGTLRSRFHHAVLRLERRLGGA